MGYWFRGSSCTDPSLSGYDMFCIDAVKEVENAFAQKEIPDTSIFSIITSKETETKTHTQK